VAGIAITWISQQRKCHRRTLHPLAFQRRPPQPHSRSSEWHVKNCSLIACAC